MFTTDLDRAFILWSHGRSLPLALATRLMANGIDVEGLERQHKA